MKNVIDVRDMHTAIHGLYLVNKKPKLMIKTFEFLENYEGLEYDDIQMIYAWELIDENTTFLGEINYRNISGGQVTRKGIPLDDCIYDDGNVKYRVIARFDLWY